jgi:hypothetical protein
MILMTMTKRLQVLLDDEELAEIQATARRHRQTTAAWVREALRTARSASEPADIERKLETIRVAARHQGPTADIDEMLAQIERGYLDAGRA